MKEQIVTCVICPKGCRITVRGEGDAVHSLTGQGCKRGEEYARNEFLHPLRILTSTVLVEGAAAPLLPVRTDRPVPKELLLPCMEAVRACRVKAPVRRYDIILENILGTGANLVATGEA